MDKPTSFLFQNIGLLADGELQLVLEEKHTAVPERGFTPDYAFEIVTVTPPQKIGGIRLRFGTDETVFFHGHVGYDIDPPFRGHHYAERACRLLLPVARAHGLSHLMLTCDPANEASRRTLERLGARLLGVFDIPPQHDMRVRGRYRVLRYWWDIR